MPRGKVLATAEKRERKRREELRVKGELSGRGMTHEQRMALRRIRIRERAREAGKSTIEDVVRFWIDTLKGPGSIRATWSQKNEAAVQLCDRFGFPRHQTMSGMEDDMARPKLVELVEFPAPPGWNGEESSEPVAKEGGA